MLAQFSPTVDLGTGPLGFLGNLRGWWHLYIASDSIGCTHRQIGRMEGASTGGKVRA